MNTTFPTVFELAKKLDQNQKPEPEKKKATKPTKPVEDKRQLSLFDIAPWGDDKRAMPNDFLRSALFTIANKRVPRIMLNRVPIYHVNKDVQIFYTGWGLRASDDELVLYQVLEYAKHLALDSTSSFTFYQLCKDIGWPINKKYYTMAEDCLTRLQATAIQFSSKQVRKMESLSLILQFRIEDKGHSRQQRCRVKIDPSIAKLFQENQYTRVIWNKYRELTPLARRMYDYFATHQTPYPLSLDKLRLLCNSNSKRQNKWREQVKKAAAELNASDLNCHITVEKDLVHCKRTLPKSKHITFERPQS